MSKVDEKMDENPSDNDQIIRTVPGTDVGGHDTAGTDGEVRTERPGAILGTPNGQPGQRTIAAREQTLAQSDFVTQEVDRTNRYVLPKLGGDQAPGNWKPEEGGEPEFLSEPEAKGAHTKAAPAKAARPAAKVARKAAPKTAPARPATAAEETAIARQLDAER